MTNCISGEEAKSDTTRSYAYVEHIGDGVARLELRLTPTTFIPLDEEKTKKRYRYPRKIIEISAEELSRILPDVKQMDVIVAEHTDGVIQKICYIDYEETHRRCERAKARQEALERKMQNNSM